MTIAGLTPLQHETLLGVLRRFSGRYETVLLFGSRATGSARTGSDIDIALKGAEPDLASQMLTEFVDSDLSVSVDVVDYDRLSDEGVRSAIDREGKVLSVD